MAKLSLKKIGRGAKKLGQKAKIGIGKAASKAAPIVGFFNPALGTALSVGGDILDTTDGSFNAGKNIKRAATTYAIGKAAKGITGLFKGADTANLAPSASGGGADAMVRAAYKKAGVAAPESLAQPSRFRSIAQGAGRLGNAIRPKNLQDTLDLARFAGDTYGAYKTGQREDDLYAREEREFNRLAPLRAEGMAGLLAQGQPQVPVSDLFAQPQSRYRRVSVGSRV